MIYYNLAAARPDVEFIIYVSQDPTQQEFDRFTKSHHRKLNMLEESMHSF
jgi:hypothetical protein